MNLLELLRSERVEYRLHGEHHHVSDGWAGVDCSLCSPNSGRFRLGFSLSTMACSCYVCGRQNPAEMLSMLTGRGLDECRELLGRSERLERKVRPAGRLVMPTRVGPLRAAHKRYLWGRGFHPDVIESVWKVQGTGGDSSVPWSLIVPIHLDDEVVSWTSRKLNDKGRRYHSARPEEERVSHKSLLYGETFCLNAVIVHEGPTDVWRTGPGAVATLGLTVTTAQVRRIARYVQRIICFDSSPDAQRRARKLADRLAVFPGSTAVVELDAEDPASAADDEIALLRRFLI